MSLFAPNSLEEYPILHETTAQSSLKKQEKDSCYPYMKNLSQKKKELFIVISPDKGLCGGLVSNLVKEVHLLSKENPLPSGILISRNTTSGLSKVMVLKASLTFAA